MLLQGQLSNLHYFNISICASSSNGVVDPARVSLPMAAKARTCNHGSRHHVSQTQLAVPPQQGGSALLSSKFQYRAWVWLYCPEVGLNTGYMVINQKCNYGNCLLQ